MKTNKWKKIILLCMVCLITLFCVPTQQVSASEEVLVNTPEKIVWGQSYTGHIEKRYDAYQYTFTLPKSGHIGMVCNVEGRSINVIIYDSARNVICNTCASIGMTNQAFELLQGEYTLKVTKTGYDDCKFSFTPTFTPSGETRSEAYTDKNNETGLATTYTLGDSYIGQLADNDSTDIYKFEVAGTGHLSLDIDSKLQAFYIKLVNDYGDISYEETITSGKHQYSYFVPKGTYYLQFLREDNDSTGTYSFNTSLSAIPAGKLSSAKNVKTRSILVKCGKNSKVSGYQIQIATNRTFSKGKKYFNINENTTSSTKLYSLKKRKTYYVRVRNYIVAPNNKNYYSQWSNSKKVYVRV